MEKQWTFKKVQVIERNGEPYKFQTFLSAYDLANFFLNGTIEYHGDIQRGTKINNSGKIVDVYSPKKVKEILEAMVKNTMHGGFITLNYNKDHEEQLEYNKEKEMLKGFHSLQISDGQHRVRACVKWLNTYVGNPDTIPELDSFVFPVIIENLSDDGAKDLFAEYSLKSLRISPTRAEYLNVRDMYSEITRRVMQESRLKVEIVSTSPKRSNSVVNFKTLKETIKKNFNPATPNEAEEVADFLIGFFNELIEIFPKHLGEVKPEQRQEIKKQYLTLEPLMFYGYLAIASKLYKTEDWINKLYKLADIVRVKEWEGQLLDKNNPIFRTIFREENKIIHNTATQKYVSELLVNYVVEDKEVEKLIAS